MAAKYISMALAMRSLTSLRVRPAAMQPGRSGTCALKPVRVGAIKMEYLLIS